MRFLPAVGCFVCVLSLGGCGIFQRHRDPPDDKDVAARCTPVKSLLSKNVKSSGNVDVPLLFQFGGLYDRTGAVLEPAEAARVARVDQACRAWVKGVITPQEYGKFVLESTSATIVQTTTPEDRQTVVDAVVAYLNELKEKGVLPSEFPASSMPGQVASDSRLTQHQLEAKLRESVATIDGRLDSAKQDADVRQAQLVSRLESIDRRLSVIERNRPPDSTPTTPPAERSESGPNGTHLAPPDSAPDSGAPRRHEASGVDGGKKVDTAPIAHAGEMDVYFTTDSAEITFSERQRLEAAAAEWRRTKSTIYVMGFADPRGNATHNGQLALERAKAVAKLLVGLNVSVGAVSGGGVESGFDRDSLRYVHLRPVR